MARERKWDEISPQSIIADGTSEGLILTDSANLFHVKQIVILSSSGAPKDNFVINKIESPNRIYVGPVKGKITERSDVSNYILADSPTIAACEQNRPTIPLNEIGRAVYQEEPAMANRVILVDQFGNPVAQNQGSGIVADIGFFDDGIVVPQTGLVDHAEYYLNGTLLATVELTYETTDKCNVVRIRRI